MTSPREIYISVDVETAGPIPGEYSLLSIGACNADEPTRTFACELKPTTRNADPAALKVTGLSLERLEQDGLEPHAACRLFSNGLSVSQALMETLFSLALTQPSTGRL
ncbi:hypothetical protein BN2476_1000001 [Paraburkholderia piptadeniae]|uniref:Exonuclease domain-containing protein n=1 Tax=Paraburkholderia piptadeniae TaxID=1701573 RepID=A0A1N7SUC3_9BURK|nr:MULTISPECIES: hypothetical protein [Paraburkholderia]SIT51075.1 hypothetical protein BN2476_1000001 [Paraburkholderia piptadeniae]